MRKVRYCSTTLGLPRMKSDVLFSVSDCRIRKENSFRCCGRHGFIFSGNLSRKRECTEMQVVYKVESQETVMDWCY